MKAKIALVVNTLSGGGAEKTAANLSRALSDRYDIDIVVNDDAHLLYPHRGRVLSLQMPSNKNRMGTVYQIKALTRRIRLLKKLKRGKNYKAVLSFSEMTNLANVLSGKGMQKKTKTILSVHNDPGNTRNGGWRQKLVVTYLFPACFKRADKTVSCSKEIADELTDECGLAKEKSCVIYNGLDLEAIRENAAKQPAELQCAKDETLLLSVGRLAKQKGQWHLIRAVKTLRDQGLPIKLVILGEGELRCKLEELIKEGGLNNNVLLQGFVENPYQYMKRADAVVFPSLYEGFSNAIAEALACGAPVISTDHKTGAREILAPDTDYRTKVHDRIEEAKYGLLVPVCDGIFRGANEALTKEEQLLADAIRCVVTDPKRSSYYRETGPKRAQQLHVHSACRQWIHLIEGVSV